MTLPTLTIYKYSLELEGRQELNLPLDSQILTVREQNNQLCLWAKVNPTLPVVKRTFLIRGTGEPLPLEPIQYVGTVYHSIYVWHIFEVIK